MESFRIHWICLERLELFGILGIIEISHRAVISRFFHNNSESICSFFVIFCNFNVNSFDFMKRLLLFHGKKLNRNYLEISTPIRFLFLKNKEYILGII